MVEEAAIEKIRKLLAHANSAKDIGNHAEATTFFKKVTELLLDYELTMEDIEGALPDEVGEDRISLDGVEVTSLLREIWFISLMNTVTDVYTCRWIYVKGAEKVQLIGRGCDREVAMYMISYLRRVLMKEWVAYRNKKVAEEFLEMRLWDVTRLSFLRGITEEIHHRMTPVKEAMATGNLKALVLKKTAAVDKWVEQFVGGTEQSKLKDHTQVDMDAYFKGRQRGKEIPLSTGVGVGGKTLELTR